MANDTERQRKLAVLIDADNTSANVADLLFKEIEMIGEASVRRIYGDFSDEHLKGWKDALPSHGIVAHQSFAHVAGKNATDIALVIDAMDLLHSGRVSGFCLVSSDSDFTGLAARIREHGLDVFGFGRKKTPKSFQSACRKFVYLDDAETSHRNTKSQGKSQPATKAPPQDNRPKKKDPIDAQEAIDQEFAARHKSGSVKLSEFGQHLADRHPPVKFKDYVGCKSLEDLIKKVNHFEVVGDPKIVRRKSDRTA